jgi:hypothetical protein
MKKLVLGIIATASFAFNAIGQKNNPYNSLGVDFVTSLKTLQNDYNNGKIKEIDKKTIDYYLSILPVKAEVNPELVAATVNTMKNSDYKEVIKNSKLTDFSKEILSKSQTNSPNIEQLVENVKRQKLSESENQTVLSSLAITYNLNQTGALSRCTIEGETGANACQAAGALVGLLTGGAICGPFCAIGGAIIGAIWGSTKD